MKKLFSLICVMLLALVNATFAQYGGSSRSGGSSSVLVRDTCPNGDTSGSYWDGECGDEEETEDDDADNIVEEDDGEKVLESIDNNTDEDDNMEEEEDDDAESLFDILQGRGGSSTDNPINGNSDDDGAGDFVLPSTLAATGADPRN